MANATTKVKDETIEIVNLAPLLLALGKLKEGAGESLGGNEDLKKELNSKIDAIVKEREVKTVGERISDLVETVSKSPEIRGGSEIGIMAKKIELAVEELTRQYSNEVGELRKEEFRNKFGEEGKKLNSALNENQLKNLKEYGDLVAENYFGDNVLEGQKNEALETNKEFGPGKLENAWTDLRGMVNFLQKSPEEIKEIKGKYKTLKENLKGVNLPNSLRESRSFEKIMAGFNNPNIDQLFSRTRKYLGWADRVDKLTGGWLKKTVTDAGLKFANKIGNQAIQEFATNSLNIIAKEGFQKGFSIVLNGILSGGVKAATTAAASGAITGTAAAGGAAVAAGAAAVSATGIGAIVVAAALVLKKVKEVGNKIAEKLGISTKKFFEKNFGKIGGAIVGSVGFLVALPALLIGALSVAVAMTWPILLAVFVGLFGYQIMQGFITSRLLPPKGVINENNYEEISLPSEENYISTSGPISLPTVDSNQAVTGEMVVNMASSLVNKVCYYYGGGHSHFYNEPINGIDTNWGQKTYIGSDGRTYDFGNDTVFGTNVSRYVYGLDCSGFVGWVYHQLGINVNGSARSVYKSGKEIKSANELQPGDLGFYDGEKGDHIGIYFGKDSFGNLLWIHDGSGSYLDVCGGQPGFVKITTYSKFTKFSRIL